MDTAYACFQARLDSFASSKTKSRRTSTRSKKSGPKNVPKGGWPLSAPSPTDLAYAGFVFKPTSMSPDNVQCFHCQTQLDGWEETDVPAYEHLTHSPHCGFAINTCIRLRNGDPGRTEDDPLSGPMMDARRRTFLDLWPLDVAAGYPSVEQMVIAGWYYDPSPEAPDGTTCAYCSLSLDAWDAGDDPTEEHRKRADDCLFFTLKDFYHTAEKAKAPRGKRVSSRSSTASQKRTKISRTKKTNLNKPLPTPPDESGMETFEDNSVAVGESFTNSIVSVSSKAPAKGRKAKKASIQDDAPMLPDSFAVSDSFAESVVSQPAKKGRKPRKAPNHDEPTEVFPESYVMGESFAASVVSQPAKKGRKQKKAPTPEPAPLETFAESFANSLASPRPKAPPAKLRKTKQAAKRASTVSVASTARSTRRNKRTSDEMEVEVKPVIELAPSPKRAKISDISSNMILDESTPINTPQAFPKPPVVLPVQSPSPATPPQPRTPELASTPPAAKWDPINVDDFFEKRDVFGIVSNIIVDSSLDKENMNVEMKDTPENLTQAVKAGLTSPEKKMSVEEWVMYNAKRGEEKLRTECERQITAFEGEGRRAIAALDAY
ncbi:BIR-domain-containing protein [Lentithecium fluviatile CBS 122367]|uniref:BIR-domain-containing protein n=1 Tax=Lentithecium fluviatile CBS 122367 TaxID=1168545 RepID=A0A6G1JIH5_9PLEO|nr:BIR-domain-containing protein [Lentithecium fluviatile CBS 122367]